MGHADQRMVTGEGLGVFATLMRADENGQSAYKEMSECEEFRRVQMSQLTSAQCENWQAFECKKDRRDADPTPAADGARWRRLRHVRSAVAIQLLA